MEIRANRKFSLHNLRRRFKSTSSIDAESALEVTLARPPPHRSRSTYMDDVQAGFYDRLSNSDDPLASFRSPTIYKALPPIPASPIFTESQSQLAAFFIPNTPVALDVDSPWQTSTPRMLSDSPELQISSPQAEKFDSVSTSRPTAALGWSMTPTVDYTRNFQTQEETQSRYVPDRSPSGGDHVVDGLAEVAWKLNNIVVSRAEKPVLGDKVEAMTEEAGWMSQLIVQPTQATIDVGGVVQGIKNGLDSFMEDLPWIMKGLDEVAKIHPFLGGAIFAFQAVFELQMTRQENDNRIKSLYVSMKDMIQVLVQLRDIKDPCDIGPDGQTLESRLKSLSDGAAEDIKSCANACDAYNKKRLLVKVLKSKIWESKLVDFIARFTKRQAEFEFALVIHTTKAVDSTKRTVESIDEKIAALTSLLLEQFHQFTPQIEIDLARKIEEKGGIEAMKSNDFLLRDLDGFQGGFASGMKQRSSFKAVRESSASYEKKTRGVNERSSQRSTFTLQDLKDELHEDWETAIRKNMETFEGKFALQQRHLQLALSKFIREENNRLIDEVNKGPHDQIKNKELRMIWKEMGWRRNVKARLFVMTLRDYFRDKASSRAGTGIITAGQGFSSDPKRCDEWAFEYININYLQSIMEAFDDDGSGHVTITEVNQFTKALPPSIQWSLPHWIAYWAIGWQMTSTCYRNKILQLFGHMFAMRPRILPENRYWADYYLSKVWKVGVEVTKSLRALSNVPEHLEGRFKAYVDYEEERIRKNLEDIRYDIDALGTVYVVAGPGRIEKHIFPLMYLLLKRDIEIFHAAKTDVLHNDELWDAAESLLYVYDAIMLRHRDLAALFQQQKLDVGQQMKRFACEMFDYFHNPSELWKISHLQTYTEEDPVGEPEVGQWKSKTSLLNYPIQDQHPVRCELYEIEDATVHEAELQASSPLKTILGQWNGFIYDQHSYPIFLMTSFCACVSEKADEDFQARGFSNGATYEVSGRCCQDSDAHIIVTFRIQFSEGYTQYFIGHLGADGNLVGTQGWDDNASRHPYQFILSRLPAETICFRPSPVEFCLNKPRALWKFATRAVRSQVLRQMWSWTYFAERRNMRIRHIELEHRLYYNGRVLDEEELAEQVRVRQALTIRDASFYRSIRVHQQRVIPTHTGCICDSCGYAISGARLMCLDCQPPEAYYGATVDFCDDPKCYRTTIAPEKGPDLLKPHVQGHTFLKTRTIMLYRDQAYLDRMAKRALAACRTHFKEHGPSSSSMVQYLPAAGTVGGRNDTGDTSNGPVAVGTVLVDHSTVDPTINLKAPSFALDVAQSATSTPDTAGANKGSSQTASTKCAICSLDMQQPCWFCVHCYDLDNKLFFICYSCESQRLLKCVSCENLYQQPTWYYGSKEGDNFMCNKCNARGVSPPEVIRQEQHTYLHALVTCKEECKEASGKHSTSAEEKIANLEEKMGQMQEHILRVEKTLETVLAKLLEGYSPSPPVYATPATGLTLL